MPRVQFLFVFPNQKKIRDLPVLPNIRSWHRTLEDNDIDELLQIVIMRSSITESSPVTVLTS